MTTVAEFDYARAPERCTEARPGVWYACSPEHGHSSAAMRLCRNGAQPLLDELAEFSLLAPELVTPELRALVEGLRARRRTCARCGTTFIGKYQVRRPRAFCSDACRKRDESATTQVGQPASDQAGAIDSRLTNPAPSES